MNGKRKNLTPEKLEKEMDYLSTIWVTEIGACPRKVQLRQFYHMDRDPATYEQYQGAVVDRLFGKIAKLPSLDKPDVFREVLRTQIEIPHNYAPRLYRTLPAYEERIKTFFKTDRIGKQLFGNVFSLQTALKCPVNNLGFNLTLPQEILERYSVSGKVDFLGNARLVEVKSGSKPRGRDYRQAIVYQKLYKALNQAAPRMGYFLLYLGKGGPVKRSASRRQWDFQTGANKVVEEVEGLLMQTIVQREKLRVDPYYSFDEWVPVEEECRFCQFRTKCRSPLLKFRQALARMFKSTE